jgi:putative zinc finger/helix-turn-helix YgiT family protein
MTAWRSRCAKCGSEAPPREGTSNETRTVAGYVFVGELRADVCTECGELHVAQADLQAFDKKIAAELARFGSRTAEAFRFMRKAIGLKSADLAALFSVKPETVSRWETGALAVETRAFALLGAMVLDSIKNRDTTASLLQAQWKPRQETEPVHVKMT